MLDFFKRAWSGQTSLAAAFWIIYFIGMIILKIILLGIIGFVLRDPMTNPMTGALINLILLPYLLYASICVWRCSKNSDIWWRMIARIVVLVGVVLTIFVIFKTFVDYAK